MIEKIEGLIKLAESGDAEAQFLLAKTYFLGDGVEVNKSKAIYWYTKASEQGFFKAQHNLACMYDQGDGVEVDKSKALYWYTKAAEQGTSFAQYNLACHYYFSEGGEIEKSKAFYWFEKAAEQGLPEAQHNLASMYSKGDGVDVNKSKALYWYTKAAEQGYSDSQLNLARKYYHGDGVEVNKSKAIYWYTKAAEQGSFGAQFYLATIYDNEEVNKSKAIYWYTQIAKSGYAKAQTRLAYMYLQGDGVEVNKSKAFYWFEKAAEQGLPEAQHNLALMYSKGDGVDVNKSKSLYWYTKAAEQGLSPAQLNLACLYYLGDGVEVNKSKAIYWYTKAAEQGDSKAQFNLAVMHHKGDGVEVNETKALELLKCSADNGYYRSLYVAAVVLEELNEYIKSKAHLESFIKQQSEDKDALCDAYYRLAQFYTEYDKEKGKTKKLTKAKEYLDLAVGLGSEDAKELLKAINDELCVGDSQNNKMGILAKELIDKNIPISNLSEEAEKAIKDRFGKMYDYLKPGTKASLVTSLLTYVSFMSVGEEKYRSLDFSSVINPITKSLEIELKHVFYTCFMEYLKKNNVPPTEFDPEKQYFVKEKKQKIPQYEIVDELEINKEIANIEEYNYYKQQKYDRSSTIEYVIGENNGAFSLGGIRKFIAIQEKPAVVSNVSYIDRNGKTKIVTRKEITIDKHFLDYICNVFKDDAFPKNNRDEEIKKYLLRIVNKIGFIASDLRNPSNHTQIMECWRATYCGNIVFMKDNFLMDFLSKIKPEYLNNSDED